MVGENLESSQTPEQKTVWDDLSGGTFDKTQAEANIREAQEQVEVAKERQELEKATVDKINKNPKAKNIFKKIALGVLLSAVVVGGAVGISHNLNSNHETVNTPISIQKVADNAQHFVDIESDDLVWMETVSNNTGGTVELNENTIGQAGSITGFEEVSSVQMDWWQGQGDMYRAIDTDGNGTWDTASRLNPYTNESETIQLDEKDSSDATTMQEIQSQFDKAQ
ncbi:hypothetical protein IKE19_01590 [Candidatus Saccharibacteria bacterium]|nr:hypothetical protein [Candidatus Saccharibacteria bacterium]